jgi:hypothetical protein
MNRNGARGLLPRAPAGRRDAANSREYARRAESLLSSLQQTWGIEAFNGYLSRTDIQFYRKQLGEIITG